MAVPDRFMIEELRGVLDPSFPIWWLDWDRVEHYVREALGAQHWATQFAILSTSQDSQLDYGIAPFALDENGVPYLAIFVAGQELLNLSLDRLMPDQPMRPLDPLRPGRGEIEC
jgi:hypothetical protein